MIELFNQTVQQADAKGWLSGEHFSVDGTLIQAWASHKSFVPKADQDADDSGDGQATDGQNFKGQRRSNETHQSKSDPDARLYRKGNTASALRYMGQALSDNRHGLVANAMVTRADGYAEREAAKAMVDDARQASAQPGIPITLGGDKGYDAKEFIAALQEMNVVPHVAQNTSGRRSAVPETIAATAGYAVSLQKRKRIEQVFGWAKSVGNIRQVMLRGLQRVDQLFMLNMAAHNFTRMRGLQARVRPQHG